MNARERRTDEIGGPRRCNDCGSPVDDCDCPYMSTEEFRNRIRNICTGRPIDAINGASHADPCVVRKPKEKGHKPE